VLLGGGERYSYFYMFPYPHKYIVVHMGGGSCTSGFSWGRVTWDHDPEVVPKPNENPFLMSPRLFPNLMRTHSSWAQGCSQIIWEPAPHEPKVVPKPYENPLLMSPRLFPNHMRTHLECKLNYNKCFHHKKWLDNNYLSFFFAYGSTPPTPYLSSHLP
jgi:hypothetical protein